MQERVASDGWPEGLPEYTYTVLLYATNFRSLRATVNVFLNGYPLDGYALLRDLKDRAIFLAAVMGKATTFGKLRGSRGVIAAAQPPTEEQYAQVVKRRKAEEHRILNLMVRDRDACGLPSEVWAEMKRWDALFHQEVHGSRLTLALGLTWARGVGRLPIGPVLDKLSAGMYMCRSDEICWMHLRTLPFLQLEPHELGDEWAAKWAVLDSSFRVSVQALANMGKPIASAVEHFIDAKFPFSPNSAYHEGCDA